MSEQNPPPTPRRKIAGEAAAAPQTARKAPVPRKRPATAKQAAGDPTPADETSPVEKAATTKAPAKKAPAKKAPAKKTAATSTSAKKSPAQKAPAKKTPAKKAPAKKVGTAGAAATKTAARKAPAKRTPAKKAPATTSTAPAAEAAGTDQQVDEPAVSLAKPATSRTPVKRPVAKKAVPAPVVSTGSETSSTARPSRPAAAPASRRTPVVAALAALVLVAGAVVGWFGLDHFRGESTADNRTEAVAAATNASETIFSFSFDSLDEHTAESKKLMTPDYAEQFDQIAPALTDIAPDRQVVVEAVTRNAAVLPCGDECSDTEASVLVFVDLDRRTQDDDTSTVFGNRIVVDLVKSDGDWLVGDIRAL